MTRLIAYYLPQYHPIPENDLWWGKGFTEWTNVVKARPLFKAHYQPRLPADLGFYDLRLPEVREEQAVMAREHGIHGFCYYHYWFGNGKQLLERPINEVVASGKPDFPFMLCWANQTWKGVWFGASKDKILIEQTYPGKQDFVDHFNYLVKAFKDTRYITIDDKPVFQVYMPHDIPDLSLFVSTFRECAQKSGIKGVYLMANNCPDRWDPLVNGFDGVVSNRFHLTRHMATRVIKNKKRLLGKVETFIKDFISYQNFDQRTKPFKLSYKKMVDFVSNWPTVKHDYFPQVVPDWDNSARSGGSSYILTGSTPEVWQDHVRAAIDYTRNNNPERPFIFIKSWNEWAEGNYLEPDQKWGDAYLKALLAVVEQDKNDKG